ncbi:siderophore-interacting protein [Brucellaceae bacterium C25G]
MSSALPQALHVAQVIETKPLTSRMQRLVFYSPTIAQMPTGPNIKLFIPANRTHDLVFPDTTLRGRPIWHDTSKRPVPRTYSVRHHDRENNFLVVDFLLHDNAGAASCWAQTVKPGSYIIMSNPGGRNLRPADQYILAGDLCALPAISNILENLPPRARGSVFIEAFNEDDRIPLDHPADFDIHWLLNTSQTSRLPDAVRRLTDWNTSESRFLWVAGESEIVRSIRSFGRDEIGLDRQMILAVGYWKRGMSEDAYHIAHDNDRDADYHTVWKEERSKGKTDNE